MDSENKKALVTAIRLSHSPLDNTYSALGDKVVQLRSENQYELLDSIEVGDGHSRKIGSQSAEDYERRISSCIDALGIDTNADSIKLAEKPYEGAARRLMPQLKVAAITLARAFLSGAPIVVRFHNDGDGSTGGIALYRALAALQAKAFDSERSVSWQMNKSIAYTKESFYQDSMLFESYRSVEKPLLVITDFGTSPESEEAMEAARGAFDIIWLDHHSPYEAFPRKLVKHYINVFDYGGDSSFTAGLLTCMLSQALSSVDVSQLVGASLVSDYSTYADPSDKRAARDATILDFLTSNRDDLYSKPRQMDAILRDDLKAEETFRYATSLLEEAISVGMGSLRKYKSENGINVCTLDFGLVAKLGLPYPLPGRYSSKLQYALESVNSGNTITLVYYGNYISMRASSDTRSKVNLLDTIARLSRSTDNAVSGGGHLQAASVRVGKENVMDVLRLLLVELGVREQ